MAVQNLSSNFIHEYEFSWTVENFSLSPDCLRGPSFSTIPGTLEEMCVELQYRQHRNYSYIYTSLKLSLIELHGKERKLTVSSRTSFCRSNDSIIGESKTPNMEFNGSIQLYEFVDNSQSQINKLQLTKKYNLADDKLVLKCKLAFSGHDVAASVSALTCKDKPDTCGELLKDFKAMYASGSSSDITFIVGEQTLRVHKNFLLSHSPVFAKMFDSDMLESITNNIRIEDADFHEFSCFLMFLYTGIVGDCKCDTVHALYYLAHKYQVKHLHSTCSEILCKSMTTDSVCRSLMLSDLHGDKKLKDFAKIFIRHHIIQVAGTTEWAELVTTKPLLVTEVLSEMASQITMK